MTTIATDGNIFLLDTRETYQNKTAVCSSCGETSRSQRDGVDKSVINNPGANGGKFPLFRGERVAFWVTAGSSRIENLLKKAWRLEMDIHDTFVAMNDFLSIDPRVKINGWPNSTILIKTVEGTVWEAVFNSEYKYSAYKVTNFPYVLGSGIAYFKAYQEMFDLSFEEIFQLTIAKDKYSSTDKAKVIRFNPETATETQKIEDYVFATSVDKLLKKAKKTMRMEILK